MGRRFPDGGCWDTENESLINWESGDSQPMGARHGDTAANHTDLLSECGRTCVFSVQAWSNLWDLISEPPSHYSMGPRLMQKDCHDNSGPQFRGLGPIFREMREAVTPSASGICLQFWHGEYLPFKLNTAVGIARRNTICNMHIAFYDEIGML